MRNTFILIAILIGGGWYMRRNVSLTPDSHVQSAGWSLPTLGIGQGQGILAIVTSMVMGHGQTPNSAPPATPNAAGKAETRSGSLNGMSAPKPREGW
jgi:hypothetical protein